MLKGRIQPFIRTCDVKIIDKSGKHHTFCFVFKNHCNLPVNQTVKALCPNTYWRGDIAILRTAVRFDGVVNMRTGDQNLSDFALEKYVSFILFQLYSYSLRCVKHIRLGKHPRIPKSMSFSMCNKI